MPKLTRALAVGAMLAAIHLVGMTAVAQAQANDPDGTYARPPTATEHPHSQPAQPTALDQSEPDATQARHRALGALSERNPTLARHRALGALSLQEPVAQPTAPDQSGRDTTGARHRALGALAAQPAATTHPATPTPTPTPGPGVDVVATLLVGLVGGLVGGAAAMLGWTVTTRRRRPRAAAGT